MADEDVTREVLFPDWEGPDKTGLTIEHASTGEMFVKEVKGESPAARSGQVHEGDQIVGATIYFDNMSTEEKTDLMKVLARHKVGLKLQNKADKSPCYSPLSTPCRSPMGTLTWEGRTSFGGSSPDIVLSGDDEDYRRIYTKKIKPRLKSEDLAEGVDVRTERHSSTSSDGSTITTITRRITTYTVDVPSDISEKLELSSPDLKRLQHESGDSSPSITILRGNLSSRVGAEEGVFDSSDLSYTGPGEVETRTVIRDGKQKCSDVGYKGLASRVTDSEIPEIFRVSAEQEGESILISKKSMTQSDSTMTGNSHMTIGRSEVAETTLGAKNGASGSWSIREKDMQIGISTKGKTNMGGFKGIFDEKTKVSTSENVISNTESKQAGTSDVKLGGTSGNGTDLRLLRSGTDLNTIHLEYSSKSGTISDTGKNIDFKSYNQTVNLPSAQEERKVSGNVTNIWDTETDKTVSGTKSTTIKVTSVGMKEIRKDEKMLEGKLGGEADVSKPGVKVEVSGKHVNTEMKEGDINIPYKDIEIHEKSNKDLNKRTDTDIPRFKIPSFGTKSQKEEEKDSCVQIPVANINVKDAGVNIMKSDLERENEDTKKTSKEFNVTKSSGKQSLVSDIESNLKASNLQVEKETSTKVPNEMQKKTKESFNVKTSEVKMSEFDIQLKQPKIVEDLNGGVAKGKENIKASTKGSEVTNKEPKGPKFKIPSFSKSLPGNQELNVEVTLKEENKKRQAHNIEGIGGGVCVKTPETPDLGIGGAELDIEGAKGGFKMPKFKMPTFGSKGHKLEGPDVDVNLPSADMKVKAPEVDIAAPDVDIEGPDAKFKGPKFNMPKMPGMNVSMPDVDFNLKGPKVKGDIETSLPKIEGDIKTPNLDIKGPDVNIDGTKAGFEMPKVKMPSLNIKGPKMEKPEFDIKLKGPKAVGDLDVKGPKIEEDIEAPDVDIGGAELDIEGPKGGFKMPTFKMPTFGSKGHKLEGPDVDVNLPSTDIEVKAPEVDITAPDFDIKGSDAKFKGPKFNMPKMPGMNVSMPDVDFNLKGPKVKGDIDASLPKIEGDMKTPDLDIKGPDVNIDGTKAGFEMPKVKMPSLNIKGPKMEKPELDLKLKGPKVGGDLDVKAPKIEGEIKTPDVDIGGAELDIEGPKGGFKMPTFKMPTFGSKGHKLEGPDVDVNLPSTDIEVKAPDVDITAPDVDMKGPDTKFKGPKFNMPKMPGMNVSMPDVDFNLKGPKVKGDIDASLPKIEGDIKTPSVATKGPDVNIDGTKAGFEMPKVKMPTLNIKGPKMEMPDVDIKLKGPKVGGDLDVKAPKIEGDIKAPDVDIGGAELDTEGPKGGFKMPKFKMPTFGSKGHKLEGPDVDINLPSTDIEVKAPDVDITAPDVDMKGPDTKFKGTKFNMPKMPGMNVSMPDVDFNLKGPKVKGDKEASLPNIKGDIKTPDLDIKGPDVNIDGTKAGFEMPKVKMPSINIKGPKMEKPEVDIRLKGPKVGGDLDVKAPKIEGDIKAPDVDIGGAELDIEGPKGGFKMPTFKMPTFGSKGHKLEGPDVDINLPSTDIEVKAPDVDITAPDVDMKGPDTKFKGPKFNMPKMPGMNVSMPDVDFNLKGPKVKGDIDASLPKIEGDIKTPSVATKGPDVNIDGTKAGFEMPKVKMPTLNIKGPKMEMPDVDIKLKGPKVGGDLDVKAPKIEGDIKAPDVDIGGAELDTEGPKGGFKMPTFKMPTFGSKGHKLEGPDVDINLPSTDIEVKAPDVDIAAPHVDIKGPDSKFKGTKFNMPKMPGMNVSMPDVDFNLKGPKVKGDIDASLPKIEGDIKAPDLDIEGPDVNIGGTKAGFEMPKVKMPSLNIKGPKMEKPEFDLKLKGPKVGGDLDVKAPKIEGDIKAPDVDIGRAELDIEGPKGGFKMPKFKMPTFGSKGHKLEGPDVDVNLPSTDIEVKAPEVDITAPDFDIKGPDSKFKGPKFNMPKMPGMNVSMPDVDFNLKGPKVKGDIDASLPKIEGDMKTPDLDIKGPDVNIDGTKAGFEMPKVKMPSLNIKGPKMEKPEFDLKLKGPKIGGDLDVKAPKIEGDIKAPDVDIGEAEMDIEGQKAGFKMPKFKMPTFGSKGHKLEGPDVDVNLPSTDIEVKAPEVDITAPDFDIKGPDAKFKGPKFNMPKMPGMNVSMPDVDFNLKGPKVKGDIDASLPKIEGDMKTPDLDIKGPDVNIDGTKAGFEMPKVKMPSLNIKGPKMEKPEFDLKLKGPKVGGDLDVKVPKIEGDIKAPDVDIGGAELDIEGPKGGFKMPKFKMPTFGSKGHKLEGPDVDVNLPSTDIEVKAPEVDITAPDFDIKGPDAKFKGPKFNMPKMPGMNVSMPDVDFNLKGPKVKGDIDASLPKIEGDMKTSDLDIKGPDVNIDGTKAGFEMPKVKMPSLNIKGPKMEKPEFDLKLKGPKVGGDLDVKAPNIEGDIKAPDVDIGRAELDIEGPKGGFKMPKFKMPTFGSKGHKLEGPDVDVNLPSTDIEVKAPEVDITAPDFDIKGPDSKFKGPKFNMPKMPGMNVSMPDVDFNLKGPKVKGDIDASLPKIEGDMKTPDLDIKRPDVNIDGTKAGFEMPKVKMPSLNIKGPKMEKPEFDLKLKGPKVGGDLDVKAPKIEGDIKAPDVDIGEAELDIEGPKGGFKMPKFKMPTFGSKGHKLEGPDVDVNLPSTDIEVKAPEVDITAPDFDIKGPDAKFKGPKFNMPKMPGMNVSMPDVDFNLKGPKVKGDIDASLPKIEGDMKTSDLDIKGPDVNIDGTKAGFEMPKVKMPSLNIKGPKMEKPEFDLKLKGPKVGGDLDVKAPNIEGDIKAPDVDIGRAELDIEGPKGGFKMPKFKMPTFGSKGHKLEGPDVDVNLPSTDIEVKAPEVDITAPDFDIKGPDSKFKGPKFNMPKMPGMNVSMPDVDFNLKGPKVKGDIDASLPKIEGDMKTPDLDIKRPDVNIDGTKAGFEMPKVKMPSLNIKGPKMEKPEFDLKLKGPKVGGDLDVKAPKIEGDIKAPDVDIGEAELDIEGPKGGFKMPKFKMPTFGSKGHKLEGPDVDVNLPSTDIEVKAPDVDITAPDFDIKGPDAKFKGPKFNMPKMPGMNVSMPDVDFNLKGPKVKGDIDASLPKIEGDMKTPDLDIKGPDVNIDGTKAGFEMPKVKMPSLNIKGPKMEKPQFDLKLKGPKVGGDLDVKAPKIEGDIKAPDVDIGGAELDIEGPKGGFKMPKFKMPTFGSKGHKLEGPDVDVNLPSTDIEVKAPEVDITAPDFDIKGPDAKFKGPKFNMPKMPGMNVSMPDVDFNLKGPKVKGDIDASLPKIEGDMKTPDLDIKGPDVNIDGTKAGFEMPKVKMPSLNIKGPKMEKPEFDLKLKGPKVGGDLDVKVPKIEGDLKAPDVDIGGAELDIEGPKGGFKMPKFKMPTFGSTGHKLEGPDVDVNLPSTDIEVKAPDVDITAPDFDIKGPDAKFKGPKFNMPKMPGMNVSMPDVDFNLKGPKVKGDIDASLPKIEGDMKTPDLDIKGPDVNIDGTKAGFEMPKVKMPSLNIKGPKMEKPEFDLKLKGPKVGGDLDVKIPKIEGDIKAPDVDIGGAELDIEGPKGGFKMPKFKMPTFGSKGHKLEGPDVDVNLPSTDIEVKAPDVDITAPDFDIKGPDAKFKGPKFNMPKMPGMNVSMPDVDFNLKGPKVKGDIDASLPKIEGDMKTPDLDIKGPDVNIDGTKAGFEMPKVKMPSLNIKGPKMEKPEFDLKFKGPKVGGDLDVKVPNIEGDLKTPDVDIGGAELDIEGQKGGFRMPKFKMPTFGSKGHKLEGPDVDVNLPSTDIDVKVPDVDITAPDVDIKGSDAKFKGPKFNMPKMPGMNVSMPDVDFNLKGPKVKGDIDASLPKIEGDMKTPDLDIKGPDVNIDGTKAGFEMPKVKMPSLNIKGPKMEKPEFDLKLKGPKVGGDLDVKAPKIEGDIKAPVVDIGGAELDIEGQKGGFRMPKFKMPTFGSKGHKLEGPDVDVNLPSTDIDVKVPDVDITAPDVDIKGSDAKFKGPKFNMPKMPGMNVSMPDVDFNLKGPKVKGDIDASLPKIEGDMKTPDLDIKGPDVNIDGTKAGFEMPKVKMPSLNIKSPKMEKPDVDIKLKGPKVGGDLDVKTPNIDGDIKALDGKIGGATVGIKGSKGGFKMPKFKMPTFGSKSHKLEGPDVDVNLPSKNIEVKTPDMDIALPDVGIEGPDSKFKGPKFNMPKMPGMNVSMPDVDFNLKGPKLKGDINASLPKIEGDIKAPDLDIKGPDVNIDGTKAGFEMPKVKMPSLNIKGPKMEKPEFDLKLKGPKVGGDLDVKAPNIEGDIKTPDLDIGGAELDIEGPKGGFKMPKFKMPTFGSKGHKLEGPDVDVNLPSTDIEVKAPDVDITAPDFDIKGPDAKFKGPKFNVPKMPGMNVSMPDVDFNLKGPKVKGDIDASLPKIEGDMKTPDLDIKVPDVNIDGTKAGFEMPKVKMPSLNIKGPKMEKPEFDLKLKGPKIGGDLDVKAPNIEGDIKTPDLDIGGAELDIEGPKGGFKMPKFKMPTFGSKGHKWEGPDVDVNLPSPDIEVKAPEVDIAAPDVDIKGPDAKLKGPKFNMPKMQGMNVSMPDVDFNLKGPKVKGDIDASLPKIEGDMKTPDLDIKGPDVNIDGTKAGFEMPKVKMPSLNIKGPKMEKPEFDLKLKGPKVGGDLDVKVPKIEGDIKAPDVDIGGADLDIEGPKGGFKMPKFKMPTFGSKGHKLEGPDVDVNLPSTDIEVKAPEVDITAPDFDIKGPDAKFKGPKFNMPKMPGMNVSMPDVDFNLKGPKVKGDIDASLPKIEGDMKTPDLDIKGPDVNIDGTKAGFEMPKVKMPSLNIKGPKMEKPEFDLKLKGPKIGGDLDVKAPNIEGDIKTPDLDIGGAELDIEGPKGGFKMPKFKMPTFGSKGHKWEGPDVDLNLPSTDIEVKAPDVDIAAPDVDIKGPDAKLKGPKFNMPKMPGMNVSMPDVDFNLKGPKVKGDIDASLPKIEGDMKTPDLDIKGPDVNIDGTKAGFEMPKVKMPTLNIKGPKMEKPEFDINLKGPKVGGDLDVKVPKIEGDIKAPDVDIGGAELDIEGAKGGFKMPKFKMPTFGSKGHKLEGPDVDVNLPSTDIEVKAPEVDITAPDFDIKGPDAKFKGPKFNMPKMPGMNVSMPDVDFNLKGPKVKGDIDASLPKIEGDMNTPDLDIKGPDVNIDGTKAGFEMPKVKMPSLNIKGPKMEKPEFDLKLKGPKVGGDLDVKIPKIEGDIKAAGVSGSNVSLPDVDVGRKVPETQADFKGSCQFPNIDIKGSEVSSEIPEISTKKMKFKMPKIGFKGSKTKVSESNLKSDIEVDSSVDLKGRNERLKMPKFKMPSFEEKGLQFEESEVDVNLPKSRIDIEHNEKDIKGIGIDISPSGKIQRPKFSMPDLSESKVSMHDLDLNLKSPKSEFEGDMPVPKLEGKITAPEVNLEMSKSRSKIGGNIDDISANASMSKFVNKSLELEGPEPKIKTPAVSVGAKGSTTDVGFQQSEVSVDTPDTDINVKGKKGKFKIAKVKGKAKKADTKVLATDLGEDTSHIHVKETKTKKSLFGKIHFPDVELDMKSPKMKGDGTLAEGVKSSKTDLVSAGLNTSFDCSGTAGANVGLEGPDVKVSSSATSGSGGGLRYPEGKLTFSKIRVPKFGIVKADFEGLDSDNKVESEVLSGGDINTQSQSASHKVSSHNIAIQSPELSHSEGKIKLKMPKFFGKSKVKGSTDDLRGTDVELGASGQVHKASTELCAPSYDGGNLEMEGTTGLTLSSKSKSASLDLFKNPRHRSSSHSDEGSPATSSPTLEAEACDVSLDLGVNKVKGKKSKLKFGTFGGFGSKSKGSYEVTLGGENEAGMEGSSSVSTPSKKSRLSSSSSSDSGSRAGLKFPKLELSVSPKK
ncbi:neuroblast differentiation-associated protein AHNAK isoform X4 [Oryzias latipes]